jgi:cellulase
MTCYQLTVTGSGTLEPKGVKFPEAYSKTGPGLGFSIHANLDSYPAPGPKLIAGGTQATPQLTTFGKISGAPAAAPATEAGDDDEAPAASAPASSGAASTPAAVSSSVAADKPSATSVEATSTPAASLSASAAPLPVANSTSATSVVASPTTMVTAISPSSPAATGGASTGTIKEYAQCGGSNYKGPTECAQGLECKQWNPYYSQCVKSAAGSAPPSNSGSNSPSNSQPEAQPKPQPSKVIPQDAPAATSAAPAAGAGEKKYTLESFIAFLEEEAGSASAAKIRRMIEALL